MDVIVRGSKREVSPAVRASATEKVTRLARLFDGLDHAEIHFSEERNPRIAEREVCEVTLRGHGKLIRAKAAATDIQAAIERVVGKLEHQIERAKSRRVRRNHGRRASPPGPDEADASEDGDEDHGRQIVKTKQFAIKPMTPEEAVLQMELLAHDFYFFTNAETNRAAVVYRRDDGQVGLIDAS